MYVHICHSISDSRFRNDFRDVNVPLFFHLKKLKLKRIKLQKRLT